MKDFNDIKIIVVGDIILDSYISGDVNRISPEAPVPVLKANKRSYKLGGAANVAMNLKALGCNVKLLGLIGSDDAGEKIKELLKESNITYDCIKTKTETTCKLRLVGQGLQMLRVDNESYATLAESEQLLDLFKENISAHDGCIISDYAKGSMQISASFIAAAKAASKMVFVDPKQSDFAAYAGADLVKPNAAELKLLLKLNKDNADYKEKIQQQMQQYSISHVLYTQGPKGMSLIYNNKYDHVHANAAEVYDVTGAGDTVIAVMSSCVLANYSWSEAMYYANKAAGLVVKKHGAASVSTTELFNDNCCQITSLTNSAVLEDIAVAKADGYSIAMTNGCFDILHSGHISFLQRAKRFADKLVVAINSDASITSIKGPERPINNLDDRVLMLKALSSVDYIVFFDEKTPANIIAEIKPKYIIKGADYTKEQVVGAEVVKSYGGEVKILDLIPGKSTSNIIEKVKDGVSEATSS